jgi:hypothetical protein
VSAVSPVVIVHGSWVTAKPADPQGVVGVHLCISCEKKGAPQEKFRKAMGQGK